MSIQPPLALTLTQNKLYTGASPRTDRLAVQQTVSAGSSSGANVAACFIITPGVLSGTERFSRVANLRDPVDAALIADATTVNPLRYFKDLSEDITARGVGAGGVLRVYTPPGEWDAAGLFPAYLEFTIEAVDTVEQRLKLTEPFWWATGGLVWEVFTATGVQVGDTAYAGVTQRQNTLLAEWRDSQITTVFDDVQDALEHMALIEAYVRALAVASRRDVSTFLTAPPGNPVVTVF